MVGKCSFGAIDQFGPEETAVIPKDVEESQRKELVEKVKSEKVLIKKVYSWVMEKIKELQFFASASTGLAHLMYSVTRG